MADGEDALGPGRLKALAHAHHAPEDVVEGLRAAGASSRGAVGIHASVACSAACGRPA